MSVLVAISRPGVGRVGEVDPIIEKVWKLVVRLAVREGADRFVLEAVVSGGRMRRETGATAGAEEWLEQVGPQVQSLNLLAGDESLAAVSDQGQDISTNLSAAATEELRGAVAGTRLRWDEL